MAEVQLRKRELLVEDQRTGDQVIVSHRYYLENKKHLKILQGDEKSIDKSLVQAVQFEAPEQKGASVNDKNGKSVAAKSDGNPAKAPAAPSAPKS